MRHELIISFVSSHREFPLGSLFLHSLPTIWMIMARNFSFDRIHFKSVHATLSPLRSLHLFPSFMMITTFIKYDLWIEPYKKVDVKSYGGYIRVNQKVKGHFWILWHYMLSYNKYSLFIRYLQIFKRRKDVFYFWVSHS